MFETHASGCAIMHRVLHSCQLELDHISIQVTHNCAVSNLRVIPGDMTSVTVSVMLSGESLSPSEYKSCNSLAPDSGDTVRVVVSACADESAPPPLLPSALLGGGKGGCEHGSSSSQRRAQRAWTDRASVLATIAH